MRKNGNSGGVEWKKKMEGTSMNNVLVKKVNEKKKKTEKHRMLSTVSFAFLFAAAGNEFRRGI